MKICILNASNPNTIQLESDVYVDYRPTAGGRASCFSGQKRVKQCTSWHSWAYALETEFFVYGKDKWQGCYQYDAIIVLTNRDMNALLPLINKLKMMKKKVAISFHEGVQDLITSSGIPGEDLAKRWVGLYDIVKQADFYINLFGQMSPFFEGWFGKDKVRFCSHGAPMDWEHGFTIPVEERPYDILVGTRTFNQRLSRNTLISLGVLNGWAKTSGKNVHFLSEDGDVEPLLKRIGMDQIVVHKGPLEWTEWLKFLAKFKVIYHHDNSSNLGQICYDAMMVDVIPVGSTTWNNILLGTDDHADLNDAIWLLDATFNQALDMETFIEFKQEIHPDTVKKNLLEIFNE